MVDEEDFTYPPVKDPRRENEALREEIARLQAEIARLNDELRMVAKPGTLPPAPSPEQVGIPAARIMRRPGGKIDVVNCMLVYSKPTSIDEAVARVQANKTAFVRRVDINQVLDVLGVVEGA